MRRSLRRHASFHAGRAHSDGLRARLLCRIVVSAWKDRIANEDHVGDGDAEGFVELPDAMGLVDPRSIWRLRLHRRHQCEGGGLAARIAGDAIGADADLPHMGTEEFLSCLSRSALEAEASRHRVLPRARVKETRAALIEQVRETGLVLPAAQFALTEEESSDFAKKGSRYPYGDGSDEDPAGDNEAGGDCVEIADPFVAPDDADLDRDGGDETADLPANPQHVDLEEDGGDLDDIAPSPIDAVDRAYAAYDARV